MVAGIERPVALGARAVHLGERDRHRQIVVERGGELRRPLAGHHGADPVAHPVQEVLDPGRPWPPPAALLGELQHRPVVRAAEVVAQLGGPNPLQHAGIASTLPSDLLIFSPPMVTQPLCSQYRANGVAGGLGLGDLVLVVREDAGRGRRRGCRTRRRGTASPSPSTRGASPGGRGPTASATSGSPGFAPFHSAKSRGSRLPRRVALAAGCMSSMLLAGQLAVVGQAAHVEVDVAGRPAGVGVAAVDQPLDQLEHLGEWPVARGS